MRILKNTYLSISMAASRSLLKLDQIEGKGRGLVATQNLKAGQIILTESPIILYSTFPLFSDSSSSYCDHCFRSILPVSTPTQHTVSSYYSCPSCSRHHFCSQKCLSLALKSSHSSWVCQALSCLRDSGSELLRQSHELQVQARFVVAVYNLSLLSPSSIQILLSLLGTPDDAIVKASSFLHSLISSLCPPPQNQLPAELTAQLMAKDRLNSFCLMEPYSPDGPQRSIKAYAIYPNATFFNHDCLPNACRFDYVDDGVPGDEHNTDIVIRMIEDVAEGREVCISYFRINRDYWTRKRILMEDYGFVCGCERCKIEANWGVDDDDQSSGLPHDWFLRKYVCDKKNCSGTLAPLPPKDDDGQSNVLECNFCGDLKLEGA
ncbi:histone-lysine N-methyltransferase ASHR2-like [Neltuma alba]|uniref:histone-lysine N-methyltransferase ASHR2-like n=1 Tax=Neltuma alba TaxID=207710 RepID=UPI0010A404A5|nr:histone-lysine N-methyltransferase ASHR2-like [Prosopis alba]